MNAIDPEELSEALSAFYKRNLLTLQEAPSREPKVDVTFTKLGAIKDRKPYVPEQPDSPAPQALKVALSIDHADPNNGPATGNQYVTIYGDGFDPNVKIDFITSGGTTRQSVQNVTSDGKQVTIITTSGSGYADIRATNSDGAQDTAHNAYLYNNGPLLYVIDPNTGDPAGYTFFTLYGVNFQNRENGAGILVEFDGIPAISTIASDDGTKIYGYTPPHAEGSVDVTVFNPDGQFATLFLGYTYMTPDADVANINFDPSVIPSGPVVNVTIHACNSEDYNDVALGYNGTMTLVDYATFGDPILGTVPGVGGTIAFHSGVASIAVQAVVENFDSGGFQIHFIDSDNGLDIWSEVITITGVP